MDKTLKQWQQENALLLQREEQLCQETQHIEQEMDTALFKLTIAKQQLADAKHKEKKLQAERRRSVALRVVVHMLVIFIAQLLIQRVLTRKTGTRT